MTKTFSINFILYSGQNDQEILNKLYLVLWSKWPRSTDCIGKKGRLVTTTCKQSCLYTQNIHWIKILIINIIECYMSVASNPFRKINAMSCDLYNVMWQYFKMFYVTIYLLLYYCVIQWNNVLNYVVKFIITR
jgi:hypothetical protein